jgi:hypothetical protein
MSVHKYVDCLLKDELVYELSILSVSTGKDVTVDALRKQIRQVFKLARRGSMKDEPAGTPDTHTEISICTPKIAILESEISEPSKVGDRKLCVKLTRRANYLIDRLARIVESSPQVTSLRGRLVKILSVVDQADSEADSEYEDTHSPRTSERDESKVVYLKEKPVNLNTLNLKYDGTTCVRVFIERLEELRQARNIPENHMLSAFSDLLDKSVLHWYRNNKCNFQTYPQLLECLREDFDIPDLDYKLLNEIRQRTQSRTETIVVYLSTMQGMFSRLATPLSSKDQLEILMHNIRPEYMKDLAFQSIDSIDSLKHYCKQLELARTRADHFNEPNFGNFRITSDLHARPPLKSFSKQVSALDVASSSEQSKKKCFRCNKTNHFTNQCKSREIVCFKCGMKGVKRPECECSLSSKN